MTTSLHQVAVLEWLWRHDGLSINDRGNFTGSWRSREAKAHMESVVFDLSGGETRRAVEVHDGMITDEATPRKVTFKAIHRRGWLEPCEVDTQRFRRPHFVLSKAGLAAYLRHRAAFAGQKPRLVGEHTSRPLKPGLGEIKRRGGVEGARRSLKHHRYMEAHHKRLADRIEESLKILAAEQEQWPEKARARSGG